MRNAPEPIYSFGTWLCWQRKAHDWTQTELAQRTGCTLTTISKIEIDTRRPSRALAERIATVLGIAPADIPTVVAAARGLRTVDQLPLPTLQICLNTTPQGNAPQQVDQLPPSAPPVLLSIAPPGSVPQQPEAPQRYQLRTPVPDFVGQYAALTTLLTHLRLAAADGAVAAISGIRGMGGIGKTELAYQVAHHLRDAFPDAQIVVELHGTSTMPLPPNQALQQIIRALTPEATLPNDQEALRRHYCSVLHGQHVLILADDARDIAQVRPLLPPPGCALLVTSRNRFILQGMTTLDLEVLKDSEAITLLGTICPRLSQAEIRTIVHACGSLPLALRVSAGLLHNNPALDVTTYIHLLTDKRQRLSQLRDPDDPHLDVAASLALSYAQLDEATQTVFRQLGVIATDFDHSLAQAVGKIEPTAEVITILHHLLRSNLIMYDTKRTRWRLHDLVRDFARQELEAHDEAIAAMWRYAHGTVAQAHAIEAQYRADGDAVVNALARFDTEQPHIDTIWHWAMEHAGLPDGDRLLLDTVNATYCLSTLRDDVQRERIPKLETMLAATRRLRDATGECLALNRLGIAMRVLGQPRDATPHFAAARELSHKINDSRAEGMALNGLGLTHYNLGELAQAQTYYTQRLAVAQGICDQRGEAITLINLGLVTAELDQPLQAIIYYQNALKLIQILNDYVSKSAALSNLGLAYAAIGAYDQAYVNGREGLALAQSLNSRPHEAPALSALARIVATRDGAAAWPLFTAARDAFQAVEDSGGAAECQWYWGLALCHYGHLADALVHLRAALAYETTIGHVQVAAHAALIRDIEATVTPL